MLRKTIIATVTAAVMATGISSPAAAQPDGEDYFKALLGIAVLGAIINQAEKDKKRKKARRAAEQEPVYTTRSYRKHKKAKRNKHRNRHHHGGHRHGYKHRHGDLVHRH